MTSERSYPDQGKKLHTVPHAMAKRDKLAGDRCVEIHRRCCEQPAAEGPSPTAMRFRGRRAESDPMVSANNCVAARPGSRIRSPIETPEGCYLASYVEKETACGKTRESPACRQQLNQGMRCRPTTYLCIIERQHGISGVFCPQRAAQEKTVSNTLLIDPAAELHFQPGSCRA